MQSDEPLHMNGELSNDTPGVASDASETLAFPKIPQHSRAVSDDSQPSHTTGEENGGASGATHSALFPDVAENKADDSDDLASPAAPTKEEQLDDLLQYTLTVAEMQDQIRKAGRKVPSERTLQRYCEDSGHALKCIKIKTTTGQEWLGNAESLTAYLTGEPIINAPVSLNGETDTRKDAELPQHEEGSETRSVGTILRDNAVLLAKNEGLQEKLTLMEKHYEREFDVLRSEVEHHRSMHTPADQLIRTVMEQVQKIATSGNLARAAEAGFHLEQPSPNGGTTKQEPTSNT